MKNTYRLSPDAGYYQRDSIEPFNYSDGSEEEQRLFDIVAGAADVSTFSDELLRAISDWPSEYHLTRARHCLLRPLPIKAGDRVLELGCGCGAITRYLGELGAQVTAIEGSPARARIAAQRCRDLDNVTVVVDDLLKFESEHDFDWVTLIGVLEYAPRYADPDDPVLSYLQSASRYLASGGRLVVAIENRLGMKYFNGCAEDHLGVPFVGVQDTYQDDGPRTFGKQELSRHLGRAGLVHQQFYYPWPDYKLPSVILSDQALTNPDIQAHDMLARAHARDYSGNELRCFDDALTIATLAANNLLADLSNSFLVLGSAAPLAPEALTAVSYGVRQRDARFCTQTSLQRNEDGTVEVNKSWLVDDAGNREVQLPDGTRIVQRVASEPYARGMSLLWSVFRVNASGGGSGQRVQAMLPWLDHLLAVSAPRAESETPVKLADLVVAGQYLDCNPANLIVSANGLRDIDLEWQSDEPIALGWVLCRGLMASLSKGLTLAENRSSVAEVLTGLCAERQLAVTDQDIQSWLRQEADFQQCLTGKRPSLQAQATIGTKMTPVYAGMQSLLRKHAIGLKAERARNAISLLDREMQRFSSLRESLQKSQQALNESIHKRKKENQRNQRYRNHLDDAHQRIRHYQERVRRLEALVQSSRKKIAAHEQRTRRLEKIPLMKTALRIRRRLKRTRA